MCYKKFDSEQFIREVKDLRWWEVYNCESVDQAVNVFTKLICNILDRKDMAPIKRIQQSQQYTPWLSEQTKIKMLKRDVAVAAAHKSSKPEDGNVATNLRNQCTQLLKTEKQRSLKDKLDKCEDEKDV